MFEGLDIFQVIVMLFGPLGAILLAFIPFGLVWILARKL